MMMIMEITWHYSLTVIELSQMQHSNKLPEIGVKFTFWSIFLWSIKTLFVTVKLKIAIDQDIPVCVLKEVIKNYFLC